MYITHVHRQYMAVYDNSHNKDFSESRVRIYQTEYIMDTRVTDLADDIAFVFAQLYALDTSEFKKIDWSKLIGIFKVLGDAVCTRTVLRNRKIIFLRKRPITPSDFAVMYMNIRKCKLKWFQDKTQREAQTDQVSLEHLKILNMHVTNIDTQQKKLNVAPLTTKSSLKDYSRVENLVANSEQAMYTLQACLWVQNIDLQKMNRITNGYNKCAMTLPREGPWEGSPAWFLQLWNLVLDEHRPRFCEEMAAALKLTGREKFCVSVRKGATHVVVFYVDVGLQELAQRTFRTVFQGRDALTQALDLLHNPHAEYSDFIARACDSYEDRGARHLMLRLSSLLAELR